ncbi:WYL domain-containing protein [Paracoccus seriniphilus]
MPQAPLRSSGPFARRHAILSGTPDRGRRRGIARSAGVRLPPGAPRRDGHALARRVDRGAARALEAQGLIPRCTGRPAEGTARRALRPSSGNPPLLGTRRYLVARPAVGDGIMLRYRLDRIETAEITAENFRRDLDFDLAAYASRAFGSYYGDDEYGPVTWRFSPEATATARQFVFHPDQSITEEPDGSLIVRFEASGHLEMAWHLYMRGNQVEVLEPAALREMVHDHRRADFPALPRPDYPTPCSNEQKSNALGVT